MSVLVLLAPSDAADPAESWPLRWVNVDGPPLFVGGEAPRLAWRLGFHAVTLTEVEHTSFLVPAAAVLRLAFPDGLPPPGALEIEESNGSGLFLVHELVPPAEGDALLVALDNDAPALVRVRRAAGAREPLRIGIFLARFDVETPMSLRRSSLPLDATEVRLASGESSDSTVCYALLPGVPAALDVEGPGSLLLRTRLSFPETESCAEQAYQVVVAVDGEESVFELSTAIDVTRSFRAVQPSGFEDHPVPLVLGAERTAVLELAPGRHRLEVRALAHVYVQAVLHGPGAFLLHSAERSPEPPLCFPPLAGGGTLDAEFLRRVGPESSSDERRKCLQGAIALLGDTRHAGARLLGAVKCRELALLPDTLPHDRAALLQLHRAVTWYRDVLPHQKTGRSPQVHARFVETRLLDPLDPAERVVVHDCPAELKSRLRNAVFVDLPAAEGGEIVYRLAPGQVPSRLRVLVETSRDAQAELHLRTGTAAPRRLRLRGGRGLPAAYYRPSSAEVAAAAREALGRRHPAEVGPGASADGTPLVDAASAELRLPAGVEEVRVSCCGPSRPRVALEVCVQSSGSASEVEYSALLDAVRKDLPQGNAFLEAYRSWKGADLPAATRLRALSRVWTGLFRLLDSRRRWLASSVWIDTLPDRAGRPAAGDATALLGQIDALEALGEGFLAELLLRGLAVEAEDRRLREQVLARLERRLRDDGGEDGSLDVAAAAAAMDGTTESFVQLCGALADSGRHHEALLVALALPESVQPVDVVLRAALREGWWRTFDAALARIERAEVRDLWRGLRLAQEGRHADAVALLRQAGAEGAVWSEHIEAGLELRRKLASDAIEVRARALLAWEEWQRRHPGRRCFEDASSFVEDYSGVETCYAPERDVHESYFRISPQVPLRLRVLGPARLRFRLRPLHPAEGEGWIEGWAFLRLPGQLLPLAVLANRPAAQLELSTDRGRRPGREAAESVDLGPGLHGIELSTPQFDALVQVERELPETDLSILPPLAARHAREVLEGGWNAAAPSALEAYSVPVELDRGESPLDGLTVRRLGSGSRSEAPNGEALTPALSVLGPTLAARCVLRLGEPALVAAWRGELGRLAATGVAEDCEESRLARVLAGSTAASGAASGDLGDAVPLGALAEAALLAAGKHEEILALPPSQSLSQNSAVGPRPSERPAGKERERGDLTESIVERARRGIPALQPAEARRSFGIGSKDRAALRRRVRILLYLAEVDAAVAEAARVAAEEILHGCPHGLQDLRERLGRGAGWERIESIEDSGGVRAVPLGSWLPEGPALRVRSTLLSSPLRADERLLASGDRLVLALSTAAGTRLRFTFELDRVRYLHPEGLTVSYAVDADSAWSLRLDPDAPKQIADVGIPPGDHSVRLWVEQPLPNHFVRVRAEELSPTPPPSDAPPATRAWLLAEPKRKHHAGTPERPLRLRVKGPAWLRIDECRDGATLPAYRKVAPGWQSVVLVPAPGQQEALFRVWRRVWGSAQAPNRASRDEPRAAATEPLPAAWLGPAPERRLRAEDAFPLGGQGEGTVSLEVSAERRRFLDEDGSSSARQFAELRAVYRRLFESLDTYASAAALVRAHEHGGPTLGAAAEIFRRTGWAGVNLRLAAEGYLQWPEGSTASPEGTVEWSASVRVAATKFWRLGEQTYHTTGLSLLGRFLSLDELGGLDLEAVDQDVFTRYRSDHRASLTVSETLVHEPWLDTRWWVRAALTSNEDLNPGDPDHISVSAGWKQYAGGWQCDLSYRATHFFADSDRRESRTRHGPELEVRKDLWVFPTSRLELGIEARYDAPDNEVSGLVFVAWHFSRGRHYLDFMPAELDFDALRREGIPVGFRNRLVVERE